MADKKLSFTGKMIVEKKIVIVGAGMAGLACAKSLKEFGFKDVTLLEARSHIGGRINRFSFGSDVVEIGAQWIHGQVNNAIYEIAESKGLIDTNAYSYVDAIRSLKNFAQDERDALLSLFDFLDEKTNDIPKDCDSGISLLDYLDDQFQIFLSDNGNSSCNYFQDGYEWYCKCLLEINGCESLSLLSLSMYNDFVDCEGNPAVEVIDGLSNVLDIFHNSIQKDSILKNKCVNKIDWSDFKEENIETCEPKSVKNAKVHCEDGEVFLADHVVVTVPLGYLKKHYQSLFVPSLCKSKQKAIQCLGFGTINKIYFYFEKPFWEGPAVFPVFRHQIQDMDGWLQSINRFAFTPRCPNVLCAWVAGEGAIVMESLTEDEVKNDCMKMLEKILNKTFVMPSRMFRTSWHSDPFSCGSYSFLSIDCEREGVSPSTIAEPEYADSPSVKNPVLLFAGEATSNCHFATVHGAYETGIREAERLFHYYR